MTAVSISSQVLNSFHSGAEFYKSTVPQYPPSRFQDYSTCKRFKLSTYVYACFDLNECSMKNSFICWDSNPQPQPVFSLNRNFSLYSFLSLHLFFFLKAFKLLTQVQWDALLTNCSSYTKEVDNSLGNNLFFSRKKLRLKNIFYFF